MTEYVIYKCGGDVSGSAELMRLAASYAKKSLDEGLKPIFVVSAFKDKKVLLMTDSLIEVMGSNMDIDDYVTKVATVHHGLAEELDITNRISKDLVSELSGLKVGLARMRNDFGKSDVYLEEIDNSKNIDGTVNFNPTLYNFYSLYSKNITGGERPAAILYKALLDNIIPAKRIARVTGRELGIQVSHPFEDTPYLPNFEDKLKANIERVIKNNDVLVVTGYDAGCGEYFANLARNGTDKSATIIGNAIKAKRVVLLKTSPVMTADPKEVEGAKILENITYEFASQAQNIQLAALRYTKDGHIPIIVQDIKDPSKKTMVSDKNPGYEGIKLINFDYSNGDDDVLELFKISGLDDVPGASERVYDRVRRQGVNVERCHDDQNNLYMILQSHKKRLDRLAEKLSVHSLRVSRSKGAMISAAGYNISYNERVAFENIVNKYAEIKDIGGWSKGTMSVYVFVDDDVEFMERKNEILRELHEKVIKL